jgi:hypothetical protein
LKRKKQIEDQEEEEDLTIGDIGDNDTGTEEEDDPSDHHDEDGDEDGDSEHEDRDSEHEDDAGMTTEPILE